MNVKTSSSDGIFGGYDVRGIYGENFSEHDSELVGKAYGTFIAGEVKKSGHPNSNVNVVLGRDNRPSSKGLRDAFVSGLVSTGCSVIDVGVVPSPVAYFASWALKSEGAAVITASHNPPKYNGIKMLNGIWPLSSRELNEVKKIFESKRFVQKPKSSFGRVSQREVLDDYLKQVAVFAGKLEGLKVVVDGGNGVVGAVAVKLFRKLGAKVVGLYCDLDGTFPNHLPDPSKPENLKDLQARVLKEKAGLGVAFDGDGDRAVFIDERGRVVSSDAANVLFIREVLAHAPVRSTIGFELRCSLAVREEIENLGGIPLETKAGRISVRESIRQGAVFGCETTGHVCFKENNGFDDGIFASAKFAGILKKKGGKPVSALVASVKTYFATRELRIPCERKSEAVEAVEKSLKAKAGGGKLNLMDGIKYADEGGWGLVRVSHTEPLLSARFEGRTSVDLQRIYELFSSAMPSFARLPPLEKALEKQ